MFYSEGVRRWSIVPLVAGLALAGCSFDQSGLAFSDAGGGIADAPVADGAVVIDGQVIDAPVTAVDTSVPDPPLPDAPLPDAPLPDAPLPDAPLSDAPPPDAALTLVDTGLIVRYFINEASSGQTPTTLTDSAPNPVDLDITYTDQMQFTASGGHRGLTWTSAGADARADAAVNGTKIRTGLNNSKTATIEVVIDVKAVTGLSSRIVHIGAGTEAGECSLTSTDDGHLTIRGNNFDVGTFPVDLPASGRIVVHAVVDTSLNTAGDRTKLYVDGVEIANTGGIDPIHNDNFSIGSDSSLAIGNRAVGGRSIAGTIYYAAVYSAALTPAEIANNVAVLSASDD